MQVRQIMKKAPATIEESTPVSEIVKTLYQLDVRHLPVVRDGALVGIISDRDLREVATPALLPNEARELMALPAKNIMSADALTVTPDANVTEVVDMMTEARIGAVPVVEPQTTKLVGIVSYVDVLVAARPLFEKS